MKLLILISLAFLFSCSSNDSEEKQEPSSSSVADTPSSSSIVQNSSSSGEPNSSSSGEQNSSSSIEQSSSSSQAVSSTSVDLCAGFVEGTEIMHYGKSKKQICDKRDGKKYVYVEIGKQTWLAENLNYEAEGSMCYGDNASNCNIYGRLYDWSTAMNFTSDCNTSSCASQISIEHQGACPFGWHLPSKAEWDQLFSFINVGLQFVGGYLKATSGWDDYNGASGNGTDEYGFSALPAGANSKFGGEGSLGKYGYWWTISENESNNNTAYNADINYMRKIASASSSQIKVIWFSIRCVKGD